MRWIFWMLLMGWLTLPLLGQYAGRVEYGAKEGVLQAFSTMTSGFFKDSRGNLWMPSRGGGVNFFDGKLWKNISTKDGLLYTWSHSFFEDKEGGIWIRHTYYQGVTRIVNGEFQQFVMKNEQIKELNEGQNWYPHLFEVSRNYYDNEKQIPVAWHQDSTCQVWLSEFDYETASFDSVGKPLFAENILNKYQTFKPVFTRDWQQRPCLKYGQAEKTIFIYPDGTLDTITAKYYTRSKPRPDYLIPDKKNGYKLFRIENGYLKTRKNSKWIEMPSPELKRYGNKSSKLNLRFEKLNTQKKKNGDYYIFTIWKVDDKKFKDSYIMAELDINTLKYTTVLMFSESKSIYGFIKDNAGTYWYQNAKSAIRLFPDQMFIQSGFRNMPYESWAVAQSKDGNIWFSSYRDRNNVLAVFDGVNISKPYFSASEKWSFLDGSMGDADGNICFIINGAVIENRGVFKLKSDGSYEVLCKGQQGFFLNNDRKGNILYGTRQNGLWKLPKNKKGISQSDWIKYGPEKGLRLLNVLTALEDEQGRYWMGRGSQGLAVYVPEKDTIYNWIKEDDKDNYGVQSMTQDSKGNLWLGTDKGLCFFEKPKNMDETYDLKNALQLIGEEYTGNSVIQVCHLYDENTLIIGNNKGYFEIDLEAWYKNPRQLMIHSMTAANGHLGESVNQNGIWKDTNGDVWLMCSNGAVRYSPGLLKKDVAAPEIILEKMVVGKKEYTDFNRTIKLGEAETSIQFHINHPSNPMLYDNTRYRYRLTGDTIWSALTDENIVSYLNLSKGFYTFETIAEKNGLRSKPVRVSFHIPQVLWQNPMFWLSIFSALVLGGVYFRKKEKEINEQKIQLEKSKTQMLNIQQEKERAIHEKQIHLEKSKTVMAEMNKEKDGLKIQAIVNQLNPHFINNALQWLQVRLDDNDDDVGVSVVGKLSENISAVFRNSRAKKSFHTLLNEFKLTENYLYIQKRRFKDKLTYEIPSVQEMAHLENINIPLLMIQIHVENAVEHGIRNRAEGGKVKIECIEEQNYIVINIDDDGVGRAAAKEYGSKGTQNGTKMLKELEIIYNKQNELPLSQRYKDLIFKTQLGESCGTRVVLRIPKKYNFEI